MLTGKRIRRQQWMRHAEGYLELAMLFGDLWPLSSNERDRLARRALELLSHPDIGPSAEAQYLRGQALRTLERYQEAIGPLKAAAESDPSNIQTWLALGWCYKRINRLDLAIESLEEALEVDPDQAIIHYNLACYWSLARHRKHAVSYLAQAIAMDRDFLSLIDQESDFDPIRSDPAFRALTQVIV